MYKKILFLILIILFFSPAFVNATTLTVKGKSGYNLTVNVLNPLNNESAIPSILTANIDSSGQVNVEFSTGTTKANIVVIARVNGKIAKKKEIYNVNVQSTSPIIVDLLDISTPSKPATTQNTTNTTTPAPAPTPTPTPTEPMPTPTPAPTPTPEPKENKTNFLTGMATSFESINLSPTTKKIIIYSLIGIGIIVLVIIVIIFLIKRKKKTKFHSPGDLKDFKVTKLSTLTKESEPEDIEEAEKRLKIAKDEINRINEILNKRRAIKEAERKLEEERRALERLRKGYR